MGKLLQFKPKTRIKIVEGDVNIDELVREIRKGFTEKQVREIAAELEREADRQDGFDVSYGDPYED